MDERTRSRDPVNHQGSESVELVLSLQARRFLLSQVFLSAFGNKGLPELCPTWERPAPACVIAGVVELDDDVVAQRGGEKAIVAVSVDGSGTARGAGAQCREVPECWVTGGR